MITVYLQGIGLGGPGLANWAEGRRILAGEAPWLDAPTVIAPPLLLPPNERRRAVPTVRLALGVAGEAVEGAGIEAAALASVFTSSGGDGETVHAILEVLASPERDVSPTRFHNSVHNAPSGYWTIATGCRRPATSLCAFDASFCAGLLEAASTVATETTPVLLAAYDLPYPEPLNRLRPLGFAFAAALVLSPHETATTLARLSIATGNGKATSMRDAALERLRLSNPAARCLPLLEAVERCESQRVALDYFEGLPVVVEVAC